MLIWPRKTEGEVLDYFVDWQDQLAEGESITTSTWELLDSSGTAPELVIANEVISGLTTIVWLSAGVAKRKYHLQNRIVSSGGRTYEQVIWLRIVAAD